MGTEKSTLHSPDPLDQFGDPLDQPNANRDIGGLITHENEPLQPMDVRRLRNRMRLTQAQFAGMFGFPVSTLRHWERGNRKPVGPSLVLLHVIRSNPRIVREVVRKVRIQDRIALAAFELPKSHRAPPGFSDRRPAIRPRGPRRKR